MDSQESTILSQDQKFDQIIKILGDFRQNVEARLSSLANRMGNLETEIRLGFEQIDTRVLALEIQLANIGSIIDKAVSVSYEGFSVVKGLRGEVMALRAESAYRNRELDRLVKIDQAA